MASAALELLIQLKDEASAGLSAIGGGLNAIGVVAGGAVVAGLGAAAAAAFSFASDSAQNVANFQAQLGATASEAEALGAVAEQVFAANWYDSVSQAGEAVAMVQQQLGDLGTEGLAQVTNGVAAMSSTFNVEGEAIVNAVRAIRDNFPGTTEAEALDMITVGFQQGLNSSGDFLDSITEYSTQFGNGGASASQFFSVMETGLGTGMLGTDKAADMFKEFVVRIQDGSTLTSESLSMLGLNADKILTDLANGTIKPVDAFNMVQDALAKTDDQAVIMQAGVGLLGTQFEDLGASAAIGTSTMSSTFQNVGGAVDGLNVKFNSIGDVVEGMKRQALVAIAPIGEGLLALANGAMPTVQSGFGALTSVISSGVGAVMTFASALGGNAEAFNNLSPAIQTAVTVLQTIGGVFMDLANQALAWGANIFNQVAAGMMSAAGPIVDAISSIGSVIAGLLMPGSPPAFLPELDQWGAGAMSAYMEGWGQGDFSVFNSITDTIKGALDGIAKASGDKGMNVAGILLGSQDEIARAVDEVRQFGNVSESTFKSIIDAAGPAGPQIAGLVDAYLDLQAATQDVAAAQQELNDITSTYAAQLDPLKAQMKGIQDQKSALQDQKRLADLQEKMADASLTDGERQMASLEQQEIMLRQKIRATETERDVALDAAKQKLDAAKAEQAQAKARVDQQKAMIDAQNKTNALIADQAKAMAGVGGAMKAAGGAMAGAASAAKPLADAVQGVSQTLGSARQAISDVRTSLADMGATVTSVVAPPMEWLRGVLTGLTGAAAGIAVVLGAPVVWSALGAAVGLVGTALGAVGAAVAFVLSPIGLLLIAAGALGAAITTNFMGIGTLAQRLMGIFGQFGAVVSQAFAAFQSGGLTAALSTFGSGLASIGVQLLAWAGQAGAVLLHIGQAFVSWVAPLIPVVLAQLSAWGAAILGWIVTQGPVLLAQFMTWGAALVSWIAPYIPLALAALGGLIVAVGGWIVTQGSALVTHLMTWGAALVSWIAPYIPLALAALGGLIVAVGGWIVAQVPPLLAQFLAWGQALIAWVTPAIPPALAALGGLIGSLLGWIGGQAGALLSAFGAWAQPLIAWIPGAIVSFLAAWPAMLSGWLDVFAGWVGPVLAQLATLGAAIVGWIVTQGPVFLAQLLTWGVQFIAWIVPQIPGILAALGGITGAILVFIAETAGTIAAKIVVWAASMLGWVAKNVLPALPGMLGSILSTIVSWILGPANTSILSSALSIGKSLIDGFVKGIAGGVGRVIDAAKNMAKSVYDAAMGALQSHSPSRLFTKVGGTVPAGLDQGITAGMPKVTTNLVNGIMNLAGKAGAAIEAGTKAMSAAASYSGPGGTGLSGFLAGFSDLAIQFNDAAVALGGRILGTATRFADTIGKVTAPIDTALKALGGLVDFVAPARANISAFIASMYVLLNALNNMAAMFEAKAIKAAATFAEGAGKMLAVVGPAIDALKKLPDLVVPAQSQVNAFGESLFLIVRELLNVAALFAAQSLQAGAAFGEAGAKLLGVVAPAIDALKKLPELVVPADGALATFGDALGRTVQALIQVASLFAQDAVDAAAKFAESAGKVLSILKTGVDGLNAVREFGPIGYEAITAFAMAVDQMVSLMAQVADDVGVAATDAAATFSEGAGKVLGILKSGVDGLAGVRDLGPIGYAAIESFTMAVDQIVAYMAMAAEDVGVAAADAAAKFSEGAGKVLAIVKSGVEGLVGLRDLGPVGVTSITRFVMAVDQIVAYMAMAAEDVGVAAADAAAAFAAGAGKVLALLKTGVDGLTSLATFAAPAPKAIQAFGATIVAVLRQIELVSATFSAEAVASAATFATNVSTVVSQLKGALQAFGSLGDTSVKPAVLGAFMQAAQSLIAQMAAYLPPNAEVIGSNTIVGLINGIYGQRSNLIAAMTNTVLAAVQAAQATLGIASPSKVFEQLGQYTGQGMAGGMNAMQPAVASAGAGLGMAAVGGASGGVGSSRSGGAAGPINITFAAGAIAINGVQGGLNDKHLKTLAGYIKEDIGADMRGR